MDKFIREKFAKCVNFVKNPRNDELDEEIKIVEKKRKLFYFSKNTLDLNEIYLIYHRINKIKESMFTNLIDSIKFCATEILHFLMKENECDRVNIIFSILFGNFFINCNDLDFSSNSPNGFEKFFNQDLIDTFKRYKIIIIDRERFKLFCFAFFHQSIKEFRVYDYEEIKKYYLYYKSELIEKQGDVIGIFKNPNQKPSLMEKIKLFIKNKINNIEVDFSNIVNKKIMTPLISATERVIDMILNFENGNIVKVSNESKPVENKNNNLSEISENYQKNESDNEEDKKSQMKPEVNEKNKSITKRILYEIIKSDYNPTEEKLAIEASQIVSGLVEMILNQNQSKIHCIQNFPCFIVEINNDILKMIPEYKNVMELNLRFIVIAKNVYNLAFLVYFVIKDLKDCGLNEFQAMILKLSPYTLDENLIKAIINLYKFFEESFAENENEGFKVNEILSKINDRLVFYWEKAVVEKGKELTRFSSV